MPSPSPAVQEVRYPVICGELSPSPSPAPREVRYPVICGELVTRDHPLYSPSRSGVRGVFSTSTQILGTQWASKIIMACENPRWKEACEGNGNSASMNTSVYPHSQRNIHLGTYFNIENASKVYEIMLAKRNTPGYVFDEAEEEKFLKWKAKAEEVERAKMVRYKTGERGTDFACEYLTLSEWQSRKGIVESNELARLKETSGNKENNDEKVNHQEESYHDDNDDGDDENDKDGVNGKGTGGTHGNKGNDDENNDDKSLVQRKIQRLGQAKAKAPYNLERSLRKIKYSANNAHETLKKTLKRGFHKTVDDDQEMFMRKCSELEERIGLLRNALRGDGNSFSEFTPGTEPIF